MDTHTQNVRLPRSLCTLAPMRMTCRQKSDSVASLLKSSLIAQLCQSHVDQVQAPNSACGLHPWSSDPSWTLVDYLWNSYSTKAEYSEGRGARFRYVNRWLQNSVLSAMLEKIWLVLNNGKASVIPVSSRNSSSSQLCFTSVCCLTHLALSHLHLRLCMSASIWNPFSLPSEVIQMEPLL